MTAPDLDHLSRLLISATPGPWSPESTGFDTVRDRELIAHLRNHAQSLIAMARAGEELAEGARGLMRYHGHIVVDCGCEACLSVTRWNPAHALARWDAARGSDPATEGESAAASPS